MSEYGASLAAAAAAWPSFTMAAAAPRSSRPAPPRPLSRDNTIQLQLQPGQLGQLNPDKATQKYLAAHRMGPKHQPRHFRCSFHNFTLTSRSAPASFSNRPYTGQNISNDSHTKEDGFDDETLPPCLERLSKFLHINKLTESLLIFAPGRVVKILPRLIKYLALVHRALSLDPGRGEEGG